jgi:hypothetical protein
MSVLVEDPAAAVEGALERVDALVCSVQHGLQD